MTDERIVELFWERSEDAITETEKKYGSLCTYIAGGILALREDVEECVNDVLLALWNKIPPDRPKDLRAYIGKAVRNNALNRSREHNAWKRGGGVQTVGEEFLSMLSDGRDLAEDYESRRAGEIINSFLASAKTGERRIFVMRYWLKMTAPQIANQLSVSESKVYMTLSRMRERLRKELEKEGIIV